MAVHAEVAKALEGRDGWQVELALRLAVDVDDRGTAAAARELQSVMDDLLGASAAAAVKEGTGLSEFEEALARKQSEAQAARRSTG